MRNRFVLISLLAAAVVVVAVVGAVFAMSGEDYWDGGEHAGRPVAHRFEDITKAAHDELDKCGYEDSDVSGLADQAAGEGVVVESTGPGGETTRLRVVEIDVAVYEFTCLSTA